MKLHHKLVAAFLLATASALVAGTALADKREHTDVTTNARTISKNVITLGEGSNREIVQEVIIQSVKYSNPEFGLVEEWVYNQAEQTAGSGNHRGQFVDMHKGGEQTFGTYEGTHRTTSKDDGSWESSWSGTWRYVGGTGKFQNIKGGGTYKGGVSSKEPFHQDAKGQVEY